MTEGALVGQGEATPLATIQQLDPIYVNLSQPSAEFVRLRLLLARGRVEATKAEVMLIGEKGGEYPHKGTLLFTDATVDPGTGSVQVRAQFPNPQRLLLPGMYVRARLAQAVDTDAFLIPQQAVSRGGDKDSVLRSELYAVAALAGAIVVVSADVLQLHAAVAAFLGAASCFALRLAAIRYRIRLPVSKATQKPR